MTVKVRYTELVKYPINPINSVTIQPIKLA